MTVSDLIDYANVALCTAGVLAVAAMIVMAARRRAPLPHGGELVAFGAGLALIIIGIVMFGRLAVGPPNPDLGGGIAYFLPAILLTGIAVLALLHDAWAGWTLLAGAWLFVLQKAVIGAVAVVMNPYYEGLGGAFGATLYGICLPAVLAGILLLTGDEPPLPWERRLVVVTGLALAAAIVVFGVLAATGPGPWLATASVVAAVVVLLAVWIFVWEGGRMEHRAPGPARRP